MYIFGVCDPPSLLFCTRFSVSLYYNRCLSLTKPQRENRLKKPVFTAIHNGKR